MKNQHELGKIIADRYLILDALGQGAVGTTYVAEDLQTKEKVALKVASLHQLQNWKQIEHIETEAKILSQLNHPGIPQYRDYFTVDTKTDRAFYLVQQLAPGQSLAKLVRQGWRITESEIKDISSQILEILIYLHNLQPPVIHRDIKPDNLIRSKDGKIFLVDFGAVQQTYYSTLAHEHTVVGTYGYMSPEQLTGRAVPATDLYGLGAVLIYLLTHRSPAELPEYETLKVDFDSRVRISPELVQWVGKLLEPDLADRFSSARSALFNLHHQQAMVVKTVVLKHWKIFLKIGIAAIFIGTFFSQKWAVLSRLGYQPKGLCEESRVIRDYIRQRADLQIPAHIFKQTRDFKPSISTLPLVSCAARTGDYQSVKLLLDRGAGVNARDDGDETPLFEAVRFGRTEVAQLLIERGADLNAKNKFEETPLFKAACFGHIDVARLLIAKGADLNARSNFRGTPLLRAFNPFSCRRTFSTKVSLPLVQLLIEKDADVNVADSIGETPLVKAINLANYQGVEVVEVVKLIISKGANVNVRNPYSGDTPLHKAVRVYPQELSLSLVKLLILQGADVNAKNDRGETPLSNNSTIGPLLAEFLKNHGAKDIKLFKLPPSADPIFIPSTRPIYSPRPNYKYYCATCFIP